MIDDLKNYNFAEGSDSNLVLPRIKPVLLFDENRTGITASSALLVEIFPDVELISTVSLVGSGTDDNKIVETVQEKIRDGVWSSVELITTDKKRNNIFSNFFNAKEIGGRISLITITNSHQSNDTYVSLLWCFSHTPGYKPRVSRLGKNIRVSTQDVCYISEGERRKVKRLYMPHPDSPDYKRWITTPPLLSARS